MPPETAGDGALASATLEAACNVERALSAVAAAGESWGAEWHPAGTGGRLELPVQAGLRHGLLQVAVAAVPRHANDTRLEFRVESEQWVLHRPAVGLLVVAGVASLASVVWPFVPAAERLVPIALVLGVGAWLTVLSRVRHQGLAEWVAAVAAELD